MNAMPDISLLRPAWLLALPLLLAAGWLLRRRGSAVGDWTRVVDPEMFAALRALSHVDERPASTAGWAALATAGIVVLALAGPAVERRDVATFRNLDGVVFVLDASPSMTENAAWPAMLTIGRFGIAALGSRPGGLVVYSGDAYVATDMTADATELGQTFLQIGTGTVPDKGSRPETGLALAARMLRESGVLAGDVVLLTDGDGIGAAALSEAARIAQQGARLSVVTSNPEAPAIAATAATGGGKVFGASATDDLAAFLDGSGRERMEEEAWPLLFWSDRGRYLLLLALIPALLLFRRRVE